MSMSIVIIMDIVSVVICQNYTQSDPGLGPTSGKLFEVQLLKYEHVLPLVEFGKFVPYYGEGRS